MDKQKIILGILIIIVIGISFYIHASRPLWVEPDSAAFFNRSCLNGEDFNTPIISKKIFDLLPCQEWIWKLFHFILIFASVSSIYYFGKKLKLSENFFSFAFISYFLLSFLLNIEDDQLAFPLIIALSARLLSEPSLYKKIGYSIAMIFITMFIWSGAFVPMLIILGYTFFPIIAIMVPIGFLLFHFVQSGQFFFNDPGNTQELIPGFGFLTNDVGLLLLFFVKDKKQKILENKELFALFTGFNILAFIYPKLAYYSFIGLLLIGQKLFDENQKNIIIMGGILALLLSPSLILFNAQPNQKTWHVIDSAVLLQMQGKTVLNEWWVGRWFYYRGGNPSDQGGNHGYQVVDSNEYWLGTHRNGCNTIERAGILRLELC